MIDELESKISNIENSELFLEAKKFFDNLEELNKDINELNKKLGN